MHILHRRYEHITYKHIYIYIYIQRERYTYIYIYICVSSPRIPGLLLRCFGSCCFNNLLAETSKSHVRLQCVVSEARR